MARITLEQISEELAALGWSVISTEYNNLKNEMHFQCPEGHDVYNSWERMRSQLTCPVCKQNKYKDIENVLIPKKKNVIRTLGLDQATRITGWSIFDGNTLIKYGTFKTTQEDETARFNEVKMWLISMINNWDVDVVGIEGIQYQQNSGVTTFQTLARLQGVIMEFCYELKMPFILCPTNTWRAHCGVKGKTRVDKKKSMQLLIKDWFDISVSDDIADAIGIGKYVSDIYVPKTEIVLWE